MARELGGHGEGGEDKVEEADDGAGAVTGETNCGLGCYLGGCCAGDDADFGDEEEVEG